MFSDPFPCVHCAERGIGLLIMSIVYKSKCSFEKSTRIIVQRAGESVPHALMEGSSSMQDTKPPASQCHYPDCPAAAVKTCRQCHQSFCAVHIHRRWWSYICEFCLLLKAAGRTPERDAAFELASDQMRAREERRGLQFIPDDQEKIDELDN